MLSILNSFFCDIIIRDNLSKANVLLLLRHVFLLFYFISLWAYFTSNLNINISESKVDVTVIPKSISNVKNSNFTSVTVIIHLFTLSQTTFVLS